MLLQINQSEGNLNGILQTRDLQEYWYLLLLVAILGITIIWRLFKRKKHQHPLDSEINQPPSEYQNYQAYLETKATIIAETTKSVPIVELPSKVSPSVKNENQPEPVAVKTTKKVTIQNEPTTKYIDDKIIAPYPTEVAAVVHLSANEQSVLMNIGYDPANIVVHPGQLTYPHIVLPKANAKVTLPHEGRTGRQGYKDADFEKYLSTVFSNILQVDDNKLLLTNSGNAYSPDISLIDTCDGLNLFIDIEIDEPYEGTNDIVNRKAIHYRGCDENRNRTFADNGWMVIRFAEIQVHQNPSGCCLYVADILSKVNPNFVLPNHLKSSEKIEQVSQWTKEDAEIFSKNRKREEYLGIESFGTVPETKIIFKTAPAIDKAPANAALKTSKVENEIEQRLNVTIPPKSSKSIASEIKPPTIIPYKIGDKWGVFDLNKKRLLNDIFDKCYFIDNTLQNSQSCVIVKNNKSAIMNSIMDIQKCIWYESIKRTKTHNTLIVKINSQYGIVSDKNVELLPLDYESIEEIERNGTTNAAKICSNRKIGIFDIDLREIVLPCIYDDVLFYNEGVGGVKLNGRWRLYDLEYRKFIDKDEDQYTRFETFQNGFSLCIKNSEHYLLFRNGSEYKFPPYKNRMSRSGNILWSNEPSTKEIYYQYQFLFSMPARSIVGIKYDKYIKVGRYSMKYDVTTVEEVYKLDGTKLDKEEMSKLKEIEASEKSKKNASIQSLNIKDTFWEIRANKLYYKNDVIYVAAINIDQHEFLDVSKFHFGFALLYIIWDVDPEFGVSSEEVGYIDINGSYYWKN